jgi:hypothetical protein
VLVEVKKLNIKNDGYKRSVSIDKMYVNTDHIISITDYNEVKTFLLSESLDKYADNSFSLIKMSNVSSVEEVIVVGKSSEVYKKIYPKKEKEILNG